MAENASNNGTPAELRPAKATSNKVIKRPTLTDEKAPIHYAARLTKVSCSGWPLHHGFTGSSGFKFRDNALSAELPVAVAGPAFSN
jgi:hypothetical protein